MDLNSRHLKNRTFSRTAVDQYQKSSDAKWAWTSTRTSKQPFMTDVRDLYGFIGVFNLQPVTVHVTYTQCS